MGPDRRLKKSLVLFVSILLALVGAFAASHSTFRKAADEVAEADAKVVTSDRSATLSSAPRETVTAQQANAITIDHSVIAGGGGTSTSGNGFILHGTIGQSAAGTKSSGGPFSVTGGFQIDEAATPTPTPSPSPTPTPSPQPGAPTIFIEEGTVNRAVALDSVTFARGPFKILTDHNFSADHHTRVILFTSKLALTQPNPSVLTVQAAGFNLPVENVGPLLGISGLDASYIVVRIPDGLPVGDLLLTFTLGGNVSNIAILSISP